MGGADRVGHQESGNTPAYARADTREYLMNFEHETWNAYLGDP